MFHCRKIPLMSGVRFPWTSLLRSTSHGQHLIHSAYRIIAARCHFYGRLQFCWPMYSRPGVVASAVVNCRTLPTKYGGRTTTCASHCVYDDLRSENGPCSHPSLFPMAWYLQSLTAPCLLRWPGGFNLGAVKIESNAFRSFIWRFPKMGGWPLNHQI